MFDPTEESMVMDLVRSFLDIPAEETIKTGDLIKNLLFSSDSCELDAPAKLKAAIQEMTNEQALMAGMFISGLLRCNVIPQIMQQFEQAKAEGNAEEKSEEKADSDQG
jgi:hypothetical protein